MIPIFLPDGKNQTFAEMSLKEKSTIGHRGKAMQKLITYFLDKALVFLLVKSIIALQSIK